MSDPSVATTAVEPTATVGDAAGPSAGLWRDAFGQLVRSPVALISTAFLLAIASMALAPWLWTSQDPRLCDVALSKLPPTWDHPFGYDVLGCDYYSFAVYGAQNSLAISGIATIGIVV